MKYNRQKRVRLPQIAVGLKIYIPHESEVEAEAGTAAGTGTGSQVGVSGCVFVEA